MDKVDEDVEAEKLRHVRALIEELLREADVCANVTLAGRAGRFENFTHVRASWSNLHLENTPKGELLRLRSKLSDYNGDQQTQREHQAWSVGVVSGMGLILGHIAMMLIEAGDQFDRMTGATHTPLRRDDPRDGNSGRRK